MTRFMLNLETSDWEQCTRSGFASLSQGCLDAVSRHWFDALDAAMLYAEGDARRAAALNNAALGLWMTGRSADARVSFDNAQRGWSAALEGAATLDPPLTGRGSIFHIRLAARHGTAFANVHRQTLKALLRGAQALTQFNLHVTTADATRNAADSAWFASLLDATESAFGIESAEVLAIKRSAGTSDADDAGNTPVKRRFMYERWRDDAPAAPDGILAILAAAHLTAIATLIPPRELAPPLHEDRSQHRDMTENTPCQRHP